MTLSSIPEIHFSARSCVLWIMSVMIYFIGPIFHFKYFCLTIFQCFNLFVNILFISNVFFHLINSCSSTSEIVLTRPWISSLNSHICLLNSSIRSLILLQRGTLNLPQILWLYFGFCNFGLPSPCGVGSRVVVVSCIVCCFSCSVHLLEKVENIPWHPSSSSKPVGISWLRWLFSERYLYEVSFR